MSPSPQALSIVPSRGSTRATSRPARAAYRAVARPTGPAPATRRSRIDRAPRQEGQGRILDPDPNGQQDGIGDGEHDGGEPGGVHEGQGNSLDDDGDVVRVA